MTCDVSGSGRKAAAWWLSLAAALIVGLASASARAQNVALVTDVSGRVTGPEAVRVLSEVGVNTSLQLDAGSRLAVIYLASGTEYRFTGPAQVRFQAAEPLVVSGAQPQTKASILAKGVGVEIKPSRVAQAAFVMRGGVVAHIKVIGPAGTRTLGTPSEFRWQEAEPGMTYHFELVDAGGKTVYGTDTSTAAVTLPTSVQLQDGAKYSWDVAAHAASGRRFVGSGDFSVATPALRAEAEALRPGANATLSDRVAYAAWLTQMELHDEARKAWKVLATERPDEPLLRSQAGE